MEIIKLFGCIVLLMSELFRYNALLVFKVLVHKAPSRNGIVVVVVVIVVEKVQTTILYDVVCQNIH